VVRATAGTQITDRTFYLDVEGADAPVFTTVSGQLQIEDSTRADLYWILDGEEIGYQLQATDSDTRAGQTLQYEIVQGSLPPGVSMSSSGYISGIVQLLPTDPAQTRGGYDNLLGAYDDEVYDYTLNTISVSKNYDFVVRVSDGTSSAEQNNSIFVYSANYWRVSNSDITIDKDNINGIPLTMDQFAQTMDFTAIRRPVFTTGSDLGTFRHDNQVAIAIDVSDFDPLQSDLEYSIQAGSLPTGLAININTGEISGRLLQQSAVETDFEFTIRANRVVNTDDSSVTNVFADKVFTMKVIGEIDIGIAFTTDTNVGTLHADQPSTLGVVAVAENPDRVLSYSVTAGSLPPGITLSEQGNLLGIIDPEDFLDSTRTFTFTVRVSDQYQDAATSKEFNVTVDIPLTTVRYGNLSGQATSLIDQNIFYNLAQDPSINSVENIYRTEDDNFGFKLKPEMLMLSGLEAQTLTTFQNQMNQNHAPKTLYFGDVKTAIAVEDGETKYEVVYLEIKDKLVNNSGKAVSRSINVRTDIAQPMLGPRAGSSNLTADANEVNVTTGGGLSFTTSGSKIRFVNPLTADIDFVSTLYPTAVENMRDRMKSLGHKEYTYLPLWMKTTQEGDLAPLGFVLAVPICYCNPGKSALVKKRIEDKNLDFKKIDFIIDRYLISRSKVTPTKFTGDGSTTAFVLDELIHGEDILVKEGSNTVSVGECVKASGFRGAIKPTADFITRSADHEFSIELSHDVTNEKTTINFVAGAPADGTIITVNRANAKYLKFRDKGIF